MSPNPAATDQMEWLGFVSFANQRQLQRAWLKVTRCSIPKACTSVAYNLPCVCDSLGIFHNCLIIILDFLYRSTNFSELAVVNQRNRRKRSMGSMGARCQVDENDVSINLKMYLMDRNSLKMRQSCDISIHSMLWNRQILPLAIMILPAFRMTRTGTLPIRMAN